MRTIKLTTSLALMAFASVSAFAGFGAGNLVIYRTGDGTTALSSAAAPVFLDEFSTAGTLLQSFSLPTAASGNNRQFTDVGNASAAGMLNRSTDKKFLAIAGYDAAVGTASVRTTASATVNRVAALIKFDGTMDTSTAFDAYNADSIRSATTVDGTGFWTGGTASTALSAGVRYVPYGVGQTSTQLATTPTNTRCVGIYNGQLYVTTGSGAFKGVNAVGTGLPTTGGNTITLLPGFVNVTTNNPNGFAFADANTCYVADSNAITGGGGLQKWTFDGTNWNLQYVLSNGLPGTNGCVSVAVTQDGSGNNVVYVVNAPATGGSTPSALLVATDTGFGSTFTVLSTAPTNEMYHGISFAPETQLVPVTITPTAYNVLLGSTAAGTVADVQSINGDTTNANKLKLCKALVPTLTSPKVRVDFDFTSPYLAATAVSMSVNANMTNGGSFAIRGFVADRTGGGFVYGAANQAIADTPILLNGNNGQNFSGNSPQPTLNIHTDGTMRARIEIQQTGLSPVAVPCVAIDYVGLTITP